MGIIILLKLYISLIVYFNAHVCYAVNYISQVLTDILQNTETLYKLKNSAFSWLVYVNLKPELTKKNLYPGFVVFIFEARFEENNDKKY